MLFIIVLIVAVIFFFIVKNSFNTTANEEFESEYSYENNKNYEIITESEKQHILYIGGEPILNIVLEDYRKAVSGDTAAMVDLGMLYHYTKANVYKGTYWYEKAMNAGNLDGMYWYGECCIKGNGVDKNGTIGYGYILMAAQGGNKSAIDALKERGMSVEEMRSRGIPV